MTTRAKIIPLLGFLLLIVSPVASAQTPTPDSAVFGPYPDNYEEIVTAWLSNGLVDPASVKIKWLGPPKQGRLNVGKEQQTVSGYLVDFTVNARNLFGAYTGPQKHTALVRDGKVVTATGFVYH